MLTVTDTKISTTNSLKFHSRTCTVIQDQHTGAHAETTLKLRSVYTPPPKYTPHDDSPPNNGIDRNMASPITGALGIPNMALPILPPGKSNLAPPLSSHPPNPTTPQRKSTQLTTPLPNAQGHRHSMASRLLPRRQNIRHLAPQHTRQNRLGDDGSAGLHGAAVYHVHFTGEAGH